MRVTIFDRDENYLRKLSSTVLGSKSLQVEWYAYSRDEDIRDIPISQLHNTILLINEDMVVSVFEILEDMGLGHLDIFIMCEGLIDPSFLTYLQGHPLSKDRGIKACIPKYQPVQDLLKIISRKYIDGTNKERVVKGTYGRLISIYHAGGADRDENLDKALETENYIYHKNNKKKLLIHVNPYHRSDQVTESMNFSYILSAYKQGRKNMNLLLSQVAYKYKGSLDVISGVSNMLDLSFLRVEETKALIGFIKNQSEYEEIYVAFKYVHINPFIRCWLEASDDCLLITKEEHIQEEVMKQFPYRCTIADQ